jgi:hypothetical protein
MERVLVGVEAEAAVLELLVVMQQDMLAAVVELV